jgi:excisionase family DNA binding protein
MMTTVIQERLGYRPNEAAEAIGVSRDTIFKALADGSLRSVKIGAARVIPADALREFLANGEAVSA